MTVAATTAAYLTVEHEGTRRAGALDRRILIGRKPSNNIVIHEAEVSRFHAWIGRDDRGFFIIDLASRSGTRVNGDLLLDRRRLEEGDVIAIGPATLVFTSQPPPGLELGRFDPPEIEREGILFDCPCGAPLWAPRKSAGRPGKCGHCRKAIIIPQRSGQRAAVRRETKGDKARGTPSRAIAGPDSRAMRPPTAPRCPVCQWALTEADKAIACPECGQLYHHDCWTQNEGCAIYGCSQVHALRPDAPQSAPLDQAAEDHDSESTPAPPKHAGLLVAAIAGVLLSLVSFGLPSLTTAAVAALLLRRGPATRTGLIAIVVSLAGVVAGLIGSYLLWIGRH